MVNFEESRELFDRDFSCYIRRFSYQEARKLTFVYAMRPILIAIQCLGNFPFDGVTSIDFTDFKFRMLSARFTVFVTLKVLGLIDWIIMMYWLISAGLQFEHVPVIFNSIVGIYFGIYVYDHTG